MNCQLKNSTIDGFAYTNHVIALVGLHIEQDLGTQRIFATSFGQI